MKLEKYYIIARSNMKCCRIDNGLHLIVYDSYIYVFALYFGLVKQPEVDSCAMCVNQMFE